VHEAGTARVLYELAYRHAQDRAIKCTVCYELARCLDSDLQQYRAAIEWYQRCQTEFCGTKEANDCGWRIEWLQNKQSRSGGSSATPESRQSSSQGTNPLLEFAKGFYDGWRSAK
ncbi:MAG TPA: hypothetical protein VGK81_09100, partial [Anaerolineae bacterium]|jgi:hypothetical protein